MLVLTRKVDECIIVGEGPLAVMIKIIDVRGDKVRVGIEADSSIPIHRKEIADAIAAENQKSDAPTDRV